MTGSIRGKDNPLAAGDDATDADFAAKMNQQASVKFFVAVTAGVIIVIAAAGTPFTCWSDRTLTPLLSAWLNGAQINTAMWSTAGYTSFPHPNQIYKTAAPNGGNVAIRFDGFSADNPQHKTFVGCAYCQGSSEFYPRRVIATPPQTVVNGDADILAANFLPTVQSLQAQDVTTVVTYRQVGDVAEVRIQGIPPRAAGVAPLGVPGGSR